MLGRAGPESVRRLNLLSEIDGNYYNVVVGVEGSGDLKQARVITFHPLGDDRDQVDEMIRRANTGADGQKVLHNSLPPRKRK